MGLCRGKRLHSKIGKRKVDRQRENCKCKLMGWTRHTHQCVTGPRQLQGKGSDAEPGKEERREKNKRCSLKGGGGSDGGWVGVANQYVSGKEKKKLRWTGLGGQH